VEKTKYIPISERTAIMPCEALKQYPNRSMFTFTMYAYTDASLQPSTRRLGLGVVVCTPKKVRPTFVVGRVISHGINDHLIYDVNLGELVAIFMAQRVTTGTRPLHVYTDSQSSIMAKAACRLKPYKSPRAQLQWCFARDYICDDTILHKVKGHAGIIGNEYADLLAKTSCRLYLDDFTHEKWFTTENPETSFSVVYKLIQGHTCA
jgi:ribonuclease HI